MTEVLDGMSLLKIYSADYRAGVEATLRNFGDRGFSVDQLNARRDLSAMPGIMPVRFNGGMRTTDRIKVEPSPLFNVTVERVVDNVLGQEAQAAYGTG
jgi:hypothetical protein